MNNQVTISYNHKSYALNVGGWLKHLHCAPIDAEQLICSDDIILPSGETAGAYKRARKAEHRAMNSSSNDKKHLNQSSMNDFGCGWDELIHYHKNLIHDSCFPLLFINRKRTTEEQLLINQAASNGHVGAMFWIGTALSDGLDENCLFWLSWAHNRGHVNAAYEIASFLFEQGNVLDALRCLIISADMGCDIAFNAILCADILIAVLEARKLEEVDKMLDQLIGYSHHSSARYFKSIALLINDKRREGLNLLWDFHEKPKNLPTQKLIDDVFNNQLNMAKELTKDLILEIDKGEHVVASLQKHIKNLQSGLLSRHKSDANEHAKLFRELVAEGNDR
ncbi:SEL1-like repeat protein [Vibrio atypicus]|uniref:hypothetical protein n=1 Tax=Vibrio atypicus TaxID=558271 RepID=UPI003736A93C